MIDAIPDKIISDMAKVNSKLAEDIDKEVSGKHEFFYWLGYYDGQNSIEVNKASQSIDDVRGKQ